MDINNNIIIVYYLDILVHQRNIKKIKKLK